MKTRIVVLGGSSPFTAALIDALAAVVAWLPPCQLALHGRNLDHLQALTQYGRHRLDALGWEVRFHAELAAVLDGADVVVHQIRYGDMAGRDEDERLALQFDLPPDETLGPGALHAMLRSLPELYHTCAALVHVCPDAWVLNLTNPLSLVTALMIDAGVSQCLGLCELPLVTASLAAEVLSLPLADVEWAYTGLNHRGFVVRFEYAGADQIPALVERLGSGTLDGITADTIAQLHAIPTKYFRLVIGDAPLQAGRAVFLSALRHQIAQELRLDATASPPSLSKRYLEWYPQSVVPMIAALLSSASSRHIVNVLNPSGLPEALVEECHAWVSATSLRPVPRPASGSEVASWLHVYRVHEQALLRAVRHPSLDTIAEALCADPVVPSARVEPLARMLWERYHKSTLKTLSEGRLS